MKIGEPKIIEYDFKSLIFKNKIIYYSDSLFDVDGYSSIQFRMMKNKIIDSQFDHREEICYIIDLTQSLEDIWNNMNRNARRNIKKGEDKGINIKFNQNRQEFYDMYLEHLKNKKHLKWYNIHKLEDIKKYGTLVIAEYDNEIISGSVFLEDENNIVYWITASNRYSKNKEIRKLSGNATYLTQWELINYAKLKGIKEYNLGPCAYYSSENETLKQFKEGLGGTAHSFYAYSKEYNKLYKIIRDLYRVITRNKMNESKET